MIEKLLRRFVSEDTEYVLKAMEQIGVDPKLDDLDNWGRLKQYDAMYGATIKSCSTFPDKWVLAEVRIRLKKTRVRLAAAAKAQKIASQFFMGETFGERSQISNTGQSAVPASLVPGIQQLTAQQQAVLQQLSAQRQRLPQTSAGQHGLGDLL